MNRVIIIVFFAVLIPGTFFVTNINAEKQLELLVSPIIPRLIPSNEPSDSLIIRDIKNSPVWDGAKFPIEGLDFVEGTHITLLQKDLMILVFLTIKNMN